MHGFGVLADRLWGPRSDFRRFCRVFGQIAGELEPRPHRPDIDDPRIPGTPFPRVRDRSLSPELPIDQDVKVRMKLARVVVPRHLERCDPAPDMGSPFGRAAELAVAVIEAVELLAERGGRGLERQCQEPEAVRVTRGPHDPVGSLAGSGVRAEGAEAVPASEPHGTHGPGFRQTNGRGRAAIHHASDPPDPEPLGIVVQGQQDRDAFVGPAAMGSNGLHRGSERLLGYF